MSHRLTRSRPPGRLRSTLTTGLKITITIGLICLLLAKTGLAHLGTTLAHAQRGWLALGLVLGIAAAMLQANQWRGLLRAFSVRHSYWRCLRLDTAGRGFDAALPTNVGGDVVRVRLASARSDDLPAAALAVVLRRVVSIPGLLALIAAGLATSWDLPYAARVRSISIIVLLGGAGLGIVLVGAQYVGGVFRVKLPRQADKLRTALADARRRGTDQQHPFARATLRGLLFWIMVVISQGCYVRAVGIHPPLGYVIAVVTCVNALSMLPISVGGYGLREGAFSALLGVGGLGTVAQGAAVGVCLSAQTLLFGLVGALTYATLGRRRPDHVGPATELTAVTPSVT